MTNPRTSAAGCTKLLEELMRYLDGELPPARRRRFERHLDTCDCCDRVCASVRQAIEVARAEGQRALPARVQARARRRVAALLDER